MSHWRYFEPASFPGNYSFESVTQPLGTAASRVLDQAQKPHSLGFCGKETPSPHTSQGSRDGREPASGGLVRTAGPCGLQGRGQGQRAACPRRSALPLCVIQLWARRTDMWGGGNGAPGLVRPPALLLAGVTVGRTLLLGHCFSHLYDTEMDYGIPKILSSGDIPPINKLLSR